MTRTILTGALIGLAFSIALTAVFFAGEQVAGLPFPPFDVFDWTARIEQLGGLITFGIEAMIAVITALGGDLSAASKPAEQLMAIGGLVGTGAVVGGALFGILRARGAGSGVRAGLVAGAVIGAPVTLISHSLNQPPLDGLVANTLWILGAYLAWGYVLGVAYAGVGRPIEAAPAPVETASAAGGRPPPRSRSSTGATSWSGSAGRLPSSRLWAQGWAPLPPTHARASASSARRQRMPLCAQTCPTPATR
ncbi:MAG: hypothetical protein M5R40_19840 [Anaerolineae bacterium]|nr:hypothetical protein [Anaerolineae bacterium]